MSIDDFDQGPRWLDYINPLFWIFAVRQFVHRWLVSRPIDALGPAIPALLMFVLFPLFLWAGIGPSRKELEERYRREFSSSLNREQFEVAETCQHRLAEFLPRHEVLFLKGRLEFRRGNPQIAFPIFEQLLEEEYLPAALFLAEDGYAKWQQNENWAPDDYVALVRLLQFVLSREPDQPQANAMAGRFLIDNGFTAAALPLLETAVANEPELWSTIARQRYLAGDSLGAATAAEESQQYLRSQVMQLGESLDLEIQQALAELYAGNINQSLGQLESLSQQEANPVVTEMALAEGYRLWIEHLLASAQRDDRPSERLLERPLRRALQHLPHNLTLLEHVGLWAVEYPRHRPVIEQLLIELFTEGKLDEREKLATGIMATADMDFDRAIDDLERALLTEESPVVKNRLAIALLSRRSAPDKDLETALQLATDAVDGDPDNPAYHLTRAKIHRELGQTLEAVADYQFALRAPSLRAESHAALAALYQELGDQDRSQRHLNWSSEAPVLRPEL